ncbi:hypothetical protein K1T71_002418 [Dendrolimus kikuchii]|uniref:Uncharacterized protein n=1 Tax=Dendrolimus kikuchii TaxID=765133 RepID=A0ACC1DDL0_9NEOP|nr:hypothetical protein K1T71_002418 [Dendrolimus kikuchii]
MAEPPRKPVASSRDPRLAYRPITTATATTSHTKPTPPTSGGAPLDPTGYDYLTREEWTPRQAGAKSRRSPSEDESEPHKRQDLAKTPSPLRPEEGGGEEMASSSATTSSEDSSSESADSTPPSRSTSYVELESLCAATAATPEHHKTAAAECSGSAAAGRHDAAATTQGRITPPTTLLNVSFAEAAASPRASPTAWPRASPRPCTSAHGDLHAGPEHCDRPRQDTPKCANCGRDHAASSKKCPHFRKEARKRNVRVPPPPPGTERLPTRAVRRRTQAPQPPLGREPQILAAQSGHQEVPIETKANDLTERGAPLPTKRKHRGGKKHKKRSATATREARPVTAAREVATAPLPTPALRQMQKRSATARPPPPHPPTPHPLPTLRAKDAVRKTHIRNCGQSGIPP